MTHETFDVTPRNRRGVTSNPCHIEMKKVLNHYTNRHISRREARGRDYFLVNENEAVPK